MSASSISCMYAPPIHAHPFIHACLHMYDAEILPHYIVLVRLKIRLRASSGMFWILNPLLKSVDVE